MKSWVLKGQLVLLCALYGAHLSGYWFLNDDAFISFRYAWNWAEQGEVVYNLGERVEGYTNFLWMAMMAGIHYMGGEIPIWSQIISVLMGLGILFWIWRVDFLWSQRSDTQEENGGSRSLLALLLLVLSPAFACWSTGGLEVMCFSFFLTGSTLLSFKAFQSLNDQLHADFTQSQRVKKEGSCSDSFYAGLAGVGFALASMTRPEGLLFFGLFGLYQVLSLLVLRLFPKPSHWIWLGGFLLIYLPYFSWRFSYYGYPLPNTYYVKAGSPSFWTAGGRYLLSWLTTHPWILLLLGHLVFHLRFFRKGKAFLSPHGLIFGYTGALSLHVAHVGGDFMALHRFMVPIMPLLALSCAPVLMILLKKSVDLIHTLTASRTSISQSIWTLILCVSLLIGAGSHALWTQNQAWKVGSSKGIDSIGWLNQFVGQCRSVGEWLNQNTPPSTRLATTAAGVISYYSQRHTVDLLGLNDEWIAHHAQPRGNRPGHTKSAPFLYPIQKKVEYLIYHPSFSSRPFSAQAHPYHKALTPRGYQWKSIHLPQMTPSWWGVWVKSSSKKTSPKVHP